MIRQGTNFKLLIEYICACESWVQSWILLFTCSLNSGGIDYINEKGNHEVQLLPGEPNILRIPIVNDTENELNETFTLSVKNPQRRVTIHPNFTQTVVTIVDNDGR